VREHLLEMQASGRKTNLTQARQILSLGQSGDDEAFIQALNDLQIV